MNGIKIKSIAYAGKRKVFNMSVPDTHEFVISSGIISHNCDSMRYMCMSRPVAPREIKSDAKPLYDPLNQFT